jgi:hypothetical protein
MSRGVSTTLLTELPARVTRFPWADVDRRSRAAREIATEYWGLATDLCVGAGRERLNSSNSKD